ncbi:MAG TPA: Asp-tRNA(Asn)/Glu-tRNA(Gln) amidotransferase subunit GatC [Candidatus Paceibacterota bacterium]|nr:Asp-tRNA(Asn)/Glu-tRNA(Gln) amidotransferase subunit GatC [Candidatus Paceibacterota bacterium]
MISREEIQNLAQLARLKLSEEEAVSLQKDISSILDYVGQLSGDKTVSANHPLSSCRAADTVLSPTHNVMREDMPRLGGDPLAGKEESVQAAFPKQESGYNVVRKIIQKDE